MTKILDFGTLLIVAFVVIGLVLNARGSATIIGAAGDQVQGVGKLLTTQVK